MRRREKNHRLSGNSEYYAWQAMVQRCYNPNHPSYKYYGTRGITICKRWRDNFTAFYEDMGRRPDGLTLERKDNDRNYEPSNCKWGTWKEQHRNTRRNHVIEFNGKKMCVTDWAGEVGLGRSTLMGRLDHGWNIERALTQTVRPWRRDEF